MIAAKQVESPGHKRPKTGQVVGDPAYRTQNARKGARITLTFAPSHEPSNLESSWEDRTCTHHARRPSVRMRTRR